jgi:hypothetical protein
VSSEASKESSEASILSTATNKKIKYENWGNYDNDCNYQHIPCLKFMFAESEL